MLSVEPSVGQAWNHKLAAICQEDGHVCDVSGSMIPELVPSGRGNCDLETMTSRKLRAGGVDGQQRVK